MCEQYLNGWWLGPRVKESQLFVLRKKKRERLKYNNITIAWVQHVKFKHQNKEIRIFNNFFYHLLSRQQRYATFSPSHSTIMLKCTKLFFKFLDSMWFFRLLFQWSKLGLDYYMVEMTSCGICYESVNITGSVNPGVDWTQCQNQFSQSVTIRWPHYTQKQPIRRENQISKGKWVLIGTGCDRHYVFHSTQHILNEDQRLTHSLKSPHTP